MTCGKPRHVRRYESTYGGGVHLNAALLRVLDDIARWGGIGINGGDIIKAMVKKGTMTTAEVASVLYADHLTTSNKGTVRRKLHRLAGLGLVTTAEGNWVVVDDLETALSAAAASLGLAGKAQAVKERHRTERAMYDEPIKCGKSLTSFCTTARRARFVKMPNPSRSQRNKPNLLSSMHGERHQRWQSRMCGHSATGMGPQRSDVAASEFSTQAELADTIGVGRNSLWRWEHGRRPSCVSQAGIGARLRGARWGAVPESRGGPA